MKFEDALPLLRECKRIRRRFWDKETYIEIVEEKIAVHVPHHRFNPGEWVGERADLLSDDWEVFEEVKKKVKKYLVLYIGTSYGGTCFATNLYYKSKEDFKKIHPDLIFIQLIEDSEKEFEE